MRLVILLAALFAVMPAAFAQGASDKPAHTGERPVDKGPYTKAANGAYQGGGAVLQGAPGAPAPPPKATPPGQMPQNAVPR